MMNWNSNTTFFPFAFFNKLRFSFSLFFFSILFIGVTFYVFQSFEYFSWFFACFDPPKLFFPAYGPLIFLGLCYAYILKQNNPLFILFVLILLVLLVVVFFFNLGVELLSILFLIIYIGAIAILFLFVIMLFDVRRMPQYMWPFYLWESFLTIQRILPLKFRILFLFFYDCFITALFQLSLVVAGFTLPLFVIKRIVQVSIFIIHVTYLYIFDPYLPLYCHLLPFGVLQDWGSDLEMPSAYGLVFTYMYTIDTPCAFPMNIYIWRRALYSGLFVFCAYSFFAICFVVYVLFFVVEVFSYVFVKSQVSRGFLRLKTVDVVLGYYLFIIGSLIITCICYYTSSLSLIFEHDATEIGWQTLVNPYGSFLVSFSEVYVVFASMFQDNIFFLFLIMLILLSSLIASVFICTIFF